MQITAVDSDNNLFRVEAVLPKDFVREILATDWLNLPWGHQEGQESWPRRRINETAIPWISRWHSYLEQHWDMISQQTGIAIEGYMGTAFWLDEPGFACDLHTDGMLPGSMQIVWQGTGTTFYWYKDPNSIRCQMPDTTNTGYIMLHPSNQPYQKLLWHAMLTPVPKNTFRLTSYSWLKAK
jgi:hypothetical protein